MTDEEIAHIEKIENIIIIKYLPDLPVDAKMASRLIEIKDKHSKGAPHKMIFHFPKLSDMTKGARDMLADTNAQKDIIVGAFVGGTALGRTILNFYLKLNAQKGNSIRKVMGTVEDAIDWLHTVDE